jgi:hypothetical protein
MPVTLAAQDVENIDSFFQKAFKVIFKSGMMAGLGKVTSTEFDCVGFNHGLWLPLESVSLWLGCHTNDSVRKEWETKGVKVLKASNRLAKMYKHLDGISAELRASDRAGDLLKARFTILERRLIEFRYLWWNLKKSLNISADNRADEDGVIDAIARSMVWGDDKSNDIPARGIKVLDLLLKAYRDGDRVVTLGEIEALGYSVDGGMIDQIFRVKGKRHPVSKIIENLRGGRYRLKPPRKNT